MPLISAAIDDSEDLNLFSFLVHPEIDQVVFNRELMYTPTVPGFLFGKRHTVGSCAGRSWVSLIDTPESVLRNELLMGIRG